MNHHSTDNLCRGLFPLTCQVEENVPRCQLDLWRLDARGALRALLRPDAAGAVLKDHVLQDALGVGKVPQARRVSGAGARRGHGVLGHALGAHSGDGEQLFLVSVET